MAGTEVSEGPILKLKLYVDKEKNKVVLAEAGKDFVVLFRSFLALPMGTIVRLLEKYKQNGKSQIGCFNNLYKSVSDLCIDDFLNEACKGMLLYPEQQCRQLNRNIDDGGTECDDEIFNPNIDGDTECDKIFVIVTDDMKVEFPCFSRIVNILTRLGYKNRFQLEEMYVDVDLKEALSLLHCLFSSETPLTDVFLNKHSSCGMARSPDMPTLTSMQDRGEAKPNEVVPLTIFVNKQDRKVLFTESGHEFVDLLFNFLAVPLESVWEITGSNIELGCVDNFCRSMKMLFSSGNVVSTCMLPLEYSFQKSLLGDSYEMENFSDGCSESEPTMEKFSDGCSESEPTPHNSNGFVTKFATYRVSDDLTVTALGSSSIFSFLFGLPVDFCDIEPHEISINKTQAISLLRASLMTSTPLTTALGALLCQKKEEKLYK